MNAVKMSALVITLLTISACGKGFRSSPSSQSSSAANTGPNQDFTLVYPTAPPEPKLTATQAKNVGLVGAQMLPELFTHISGISVGGLVSGSRSVMITLQCPQGNTVMNAMGTLGLSTANLTVTGTLTGGSANITFNACQFESGVSISGQLALGNASGTSTVSTNTLTSSAQAKLTGTLQVTTSTGTHSCTIDLNTTMTATGSLSPTTTSANGTINASAMGAACGYNIAESLNLTL